MAESQWFEMGSGITGTNYACNLFSTSPFQWFSFSANLLLLCISCCCYPMKLKLVPWTQGMEGKKRKKKQIELSYFHDMGSANSHDAKFQKSRNSRWVCFYASSLTTCLDTLVTPDAVP